MDKRYQPLKDYGRVNKKPKLEIVVNKGRPNQSKPIAGPSREAVKSSPDDFWDDDDEVILLASQVVEKATAPSNTIQTMDFSFSDFAPHERGTSTQKPVAQDVELFSELLDDDWGMDVPEEPVFKVPISAPLKRPHQALEPASSASEKQQPIEEKKDQALSQQQLSQSFSLNQSNMPSKSTANREKAHECQIQFLQKRADTLKKENIKIAKELDEFKNKMESKDGEVSLLRDEIRHLKQQIQAAHREKLERGNVAKAEWQEKVNELAKQVEAQQTVLEFKTMEISRLKMNHADETMRFEQSMRGNLNESIGQQTNNKVTSANRRSLIHLQTIGRQTNAQNACHIPIEIFDHSQQEKGNSKHRKDVFQREMERLQFQMSRLQYASQMKTEERSALATNIINSAKNVFAEFWTYVHSLEYSKHCQSLPFHEYDITKDSRSSNKSFSLFQSDSLFPNEKVINLRRYVAGLSIACHIVPEVGDLLFTTQHNEYLLIEIIVDALNKLGFSQEMCSHFGVIEAFALLLSSLWKNHSDCNKYLDHLMNFLKTLVFCRPNAWASKYVSRCLLKASAVIKEQLCCNSRLQSFSVSQSMYKFSTQSCILQVYAGMLEIGFPLHQTLNSCQFKLLCEICLNHLNFVMSCLVDPPRFVMDILPCEDDMDEEGPLSQRTEVNITCQCYVMMCSSAVKLLYLVMRQWQRSECQEECKIVENLSKVGVRLVHAIYIRYYMTKLFDHKGYLTRYYLYFVCKYWQKDADSLHFTEIHREPLDQLASSHIIEINTTPMEPDLAKIERDLKKWYAQSGDRRSTENGCTNVSKQLRDFAQLGIMEKGCQKDVFFKRY